MRALVVVLALLWIVPAQAEPHWAAKPVQCSTPEEVNERQISQGLKPFIGMVTNARIEQDIFELPVVMFYSPDDGSFAIVEYNYDAEVACIVFIGAAVDFEVADYFFPKKST